MYHSPERSRAFKEAVHSSTPPLRILDIGTGHEHAESQIERYDLCSLESSVLTLDIDDHVKPDMLSSAANLPLQSHTFDVVFLESVLEHMRFEEIPRTFEETRRVLKPGGVIAGWVPSCYPYHGGGVMRDDLRFTSVGIERLLEPFNGVVIEACGGPLSVQLVHTPKVPTARLKQYTETVESRVRDYLPDAHRDALPSVGFRFHAKAPS